MEQLDRPMLLMIHGLIGSLDYFDPGRRIGQARVVALDLLGYGSLAGVPIRELTLAGQVEHVVELVREQPADAVWLVGYSMCGAVAMLAADRIPDRVAGERSVVDWDVPDFVRRAARSYTEQPGAGHLMMLADPDAFCQIVNGILRRA